MTKLVIGKDRVSALEVDRFISGTVDAYQCTATFSKDWEGLNREIVFRASPTDDPCDEIYAKVPAISMTVRFAIQSKLFAIPVNKLQVAAVGYKKGRTRVKVLGTPWASLGRVIEGAVVPPTCPEDEPNTPDLTPLLSGGEAGQVLAKASDFDYDFIWTNMSTLPVGGTTIIANAPIGSILFWSGSTTSIPEGWALCNGQNGTPDLRDKILVGASGNAEPAGATNIYKVASDDINLTQPTYSLPVIMKISETETPPSGDGTPGQPGAPGKSAYELAVEAGFEGTLEEWLKSLEGKSAYDLALQAGYKGTEEEFAGILNDISDLPITKQTVINHKDNIPADGAGAYYFQNVTLSPTSKMDISFVRDFVYLDDSDPTKLRITTLRNLMYECSYDDAGNIITIEKVEMTGKGEKGDPGKSAYQLAVDHGFSGTEQQWLASLVGEEGASAYEVAQKEGYQGTIDDWLLSLKGKDGKSAFSVAVENGFEGTEAEWIESISVKIPNVFVTKEEYEAMSEEDKNAEKVYLVSGENPEIAEIKSSLSQKQDKLIPGAGINITGNVISVAEAATRVASDPTEDNIVGTYDDGRSIYRKYFTVTVPTDCTTAWKLLIPKGDVDENIDFPLRYWGHYNDAVLHVPIPTPATTSDGTDPITLRWHHMDGLQIVSKFSSILGKEVKITMEYVVKDEEVT